MTQPKALGRDDLVAFCDAVDEARRFRTRPNASFIVDDTTIEALRLIDAMLPAVRALLEPAADVEAFITENSQSPEVVECWSDDLRALAASLRAERGWVPVTERLPEKSGGYLVTMLWTDSETGETAKSIREDHYIACDKIWTEEDDSIRVTHWREMPLPDGSTCDACPSAHVMWNRHYGLEAESGGKE